MAGKKGMHSTEGLRAIAKAMRTRVISAESRAKMSASAKRKRISPEQRAKISASLKARHLVRSPETRAKMGWPKGTKFSEAHKAELRRVWDATHRPKGSERK